MQAQLQAAGLDWVRRLPAVDGTQLAPSTASRLSRRRC
jgi:hypothetical protein